MSRNLARENNLLLRALLTEKGTMILWCGGYIKGVTVDGDVPYIILYPAHESYNEKFCRVYQGQFNKLPAFIDTVDFEKNVNMSKSNPNKGEAIERGLYIECPAFEVLRQWGNETQMGREKRFMGVLRLSKEAQQAAAEAKRGQYKVGPPSQPSRPEPKVVTKTNGKPIAVHDSVAKIVNQGEAKSMLNWAWKQETFSSKKAILDYFNTTLLVYVTKQPDSTLKDVKLEWKRLIETIGEGTVVKIEQEAQTNKALAEKLFLEEKWYDCASVMGRIFLNVDQQLIQATALDIFEQHGFNKDGDKVFASFYEEIAGMNDG